MPCWVWPPARPRRSSRLPGSSYVRHPFERAVPQRPLAGRRLGTPAYRQEAAMSYARTDERWLLGRCHLGFWHGGSYQADGRLGRIAPQLAKQLHPDRGHNVRMAEEAFKGAHSAVQPEGRAVVDRPALALTRGVWETAYGHSGDRCLPDAVVLPAVRLHRLAALDRRWRWARQRQQADCAGGRGTRRKERVGCHRRCRRPSQAQARGQSFRPGVRSRDVGHAQVCASESRKQTLHVQLRC